MSTTVTHAQSKRADLCGAGGSTRSDKSVTAPKQTELALRQSLAHGAIGPKSLQVATSIAAC